MVLKRFEVMVLTSLSVWYLVGVSETESESRGPDELGPLRSDRIETLRLLN